MQFGSDDSELPQRELGTRVHACLEQSDWLELEKLESEAGSERLNAKAIVKWAKSSSLMGVPHGHEAGREVWTELAFEIPLGREVLVGAIDRVVCEQFEGKTRWRVIDFKVTQGTKTAQSLLETYGMQLRLYMTALNHLKGTPDPGDSAGEAVEAWIADIAPSGVTEHRIELDKNRAFDAAALAAEASEIVSGRAGEPRPGPSCRFCQHRALCPEGRATEL